MAIPARLKLQPFDNAVIARMTTLCDLIERKLESGEDALALLAEWHEYARRRCDPYDFLTYWKSVSQKTFVLDALNPGPSYDQEVQFQEVIEVLDAIARAAVPESEINYYIGWLEAQFPDSNISDLIFWPDEWFGDPFLFRDKDGAFKPDSTLSNDQIIGYAMAKSGRHLKDAPPDITLPLAMPKSGC